MIAYMSIGIASAQTTQTTEIWGDLPTLDVNNQEQQLEYQQYAKDLVRQLYNNFAILLAKNDPITNNPISDSRRKKAESDALSLFRGRGDTVTLEDGTKRTARVETTSANKPKASPNSTPIKKYLSVTMPKLRKKYNTDVYMTIVGDSLNSTQFRKSANGILTSTISYHQYFYGEGVTNEKPFVYDDYTLKKVQILLIPYKTESGAIEYQMRLFDITAHETWRKKTER